REDAAVDELIVSEGRSSVLSAIFEELDLVVFPIGVAEVEDELLDHGAEVVSLPYNILQVQPYRSIKAKLEAKQVGVLAHSTLFYGLLTGRWAPNKDFAYGDHRMDRWPNNAVAQRVRQLEAIRPLVSGDVPTMRSAALRFVLSQEGIHGAILGPKFAAQLDQLVRECTGDPPYLSEPKLNALEGRLEHWGVER
ncbi:MAG: aldo/keto reductase, partial [Polyangiaceae bacterium]|nr:aldo/keto reductase [Polyangiaceae bacterium]